MASYLSMLMGKKKKKTSLATRVKKLATRVAKKEKIAKLRAAEQSLRAKLAKY